MDYKYIEQLIDSYFACQTTPEEEKILREFFSQQEVPAQLARYKALFDYQTRERQVRLASDFDRRLMDRIAREAPVKARRLSLSRRLMPFYKAAASIAVVMLLGTAAQHSFRPKEAPVWDYNSTTYKDTYKDPQVAYDATLDVLRSVSDGMRAAEADSLQGLNPDSLKKG